MQDTPMTPEEYERLYKKRVRYGDTYDHNVDRHLPPEPKRTKTGKISKRQPKFYNTSPRHYYQSQCSFRGLRATGTLEELYALLQGRDRTKDDQIKAEQDKIHELINDHEREVEKQAKEQWWRDPQRTLDDKANEDAFRALKESLERDDTLRRSCHIFKLMCDNLEAAARQSGLGYELVDAPLSVSYDSWFGRVKCHLVGNPVAVKETARKLNEIVEKEESAAKAKKESAQEAKRAEKKEKRRALLAEAMLMPDWDLTGTWEVKCHELAHHSDEYRAKKLTMEIWKDDFDLADPRDGDDHLYEDYYDRYDEDEINQQTHGKMKVGNLLNGDPNNDARIPRYCAEFDLGVYEGWMRFFPQAASRESKEIFSVRYNPTFELIWRGCDAGEGEIQTEAFSRTERITFADYGTTFHATFYAPAIGPLELRGLKVAHGRGRKKSSAQDWADLCERAWERGHSTRWGGW